MNNARKEWLVVGFTALILFLVCLTELLYLNHLRSLCRRKYPEVWQTTQYDGATNLLSTWNFIDQELYASKVNQVRVHGVPWNPFFKDQRTLVSALPDALCFYIIAALSMPFKQLGLAWLYISYFLMSVWLVVLYNFFRSNLTRRPVRPLLMLAIGLAILIFGDAWMQMRIDFGIPNPGKFLVDLINIDTHKWRGIQFMRLTTPLLCSLLVLGWFTQFLNSLSSSRSTLKGVLAGLTAALLYFVHFYDWTFVLGLLGILALASSFLPSFFIYRRPVWAALLTMVIGILPWVILSAKQLDPSVLQRAGLTRGSEFDIGGIVPVILGFWILAKSRSASSWMATPFWRVMSCGLIAGGLMLNSDLIVRFSIQKAAWYRELNLVLVLMMAGWLLHWLEERQHIELHAGWLIIVLLGILFLDNKSFAERYYLSAGLPHAWEDAFQWTNEHLQTDSKILSLSPILTRMLPIYTRAKLQVGDGYPMLNNVSTEENVRRMAILLRTMSVKKTEFLQDRWYVKTQTAELPVRLLGCVPLDRVPMEKKWVIILGHFSELNIGDEVAARHMEDILTRYLPTVAPLNEDYYVWLQPGDDRLLDPPIEKRRDLQLVFQNSGVRLYHHIPS